MNEPIAMAFEITSSEKFCGTTLYVQILLDGGQTFVGTAQITFIPAELPFVKVPPSTDSTSTAVSKKTKIPFMASAKLVGLDV